jgi:hypothetical protein
MIRFHRGGRRARRHEAPRLMTISPLPNPGRHDEARWRLECGWRSRRRSTTHRSAPSTLEGGCRCANRPWRRSPRR